MKSLTLSQNIDDINDFEFVENNNNVSESQSLDISIDSTENNPYIPDIISSRGMPYFPHRFEAPLIGIINDIHIETLDYMVGMNNFTELFKKLGIGSRNNSNDIDRINSIYEILNVDVMSAISALTHDEVYQISEYTSRVESSIYSIIGFDFYIIKHLQQHHIKEIFKDVENNILHRFITLTYQKKNLIVHLYPHKCMKLKNISYEDAQSYCISVMWATLINIVHAGMCIENDDEEKLIVTLLKEVFYQLNPILTKFMIYSTRPITPEGYSFVYELQQLLPAKKHFTMKVSQNHVNYRWSPFSERFEDYIARFYRTRFPIPEEEIDDLRGDGDGKRCCKYDCRIKDGNLITKVTVVGQNIVRDITGFYTTQIYGFLCDEDYLKHLELAVLFTFLTATAQHNNLFKGLMQKTHLQMMCGKFKGHFFSKDEKPAIGEYSLNTVAYARNKLRKKVFKTIEPNNDYYIATQLIEKFNIQRNVPKDIITILRILSLPEEEQEQAIENNVERHKRAGIHEKIEFAKTLQPPKHILNRLYNYLLREGFRI